MSTYFNKGKGTELTGWATSRVTHHTACWAGCCVLCGLIALLLIMQLVLFLSPTALAVQRDFGKQEDLDRAGVSVVRLVATYKLQPGGIGLVGSPHLGPSSKSASAPGSIACTGIGALVASWASTDPNENNAWVLTDGSLVSLDSPSFKALNCPMAGVTIPPGLFSLASVTVYASTAYSSASQPGFSGVLSSVECSQGKGKCSDGVSLFGFHSNVLLPFLTLPTTPAQTSSQGAAIGLNQPVGLQTATATPTPQALLTPVRVPVAAGTDLAALGLTAGTPLVDTQGFLASLYIVGNTQTTAVGSQDIRTFVGNQHIEENTTTHKNVAHDNWDLGVSDYYAHNLSKAHSEFMAAFQANPNFQGAQTFADFTASQEASNGGTNGSGGAPPKHSGAGLLVPGIGSIPYPVLIIGIVGLIILILLLIVLSRLFRQARLSREFVEADHEAKVQAAKIQEMEAAQPQVPYQAPPPSVSPPVQQASPVQSPWDQPTLVPGSTPIAPQGVPQQTNAASTAASSQPPMLATSAPVSSPMQTGSRADPPTLVDMPQARQSNGQLDEETTLALRRPTLPLPAQSGPLGFEIITNTDPGVKRKYKPNEDSLFAIQGARNFNGMLQQIGLFVVADGMGGHANGQVASKLAIQTIINYVLPRLVHGNDPNETPAQLLLDSVQAANQAVHKNNMENHADMGTTVTATLVIGTTAYVANVGDSRTYLYRVGEGLSKVTRDHSVVASLVDAGIIKPDDIYTHPKRNQIYRSLGEKPIVEVDPFAVSLRPGDKMLLCSDGLWDMVRDPKIEEVLKTPMSDPRQVGENLIQAAIAGGGEDNISVIVINVADTPPKNLQPGLQVIYVQDGVNLPQL